MLEIRELATAYGKIEALKGVSLQAKAGEVTCLLGPNGAGKTTLMMTLSGILKPQRGSIKFEGEELVGRAVGVVHRQHEPFDVSKVKVTPLISQAPVGRHDARRPNAL